jgi:hypothetical protein
MLLCTVSLMIKFAHRIETKDGSESVFVITNALSVTYAATIVFIFRHLYRFYGWSSNVSMIMLISEDMMTAMNGYIGEKKGVYTPSQAGMQRSMQPAQQLPVISLGKRKILYTTI